MSVSVSTLQTVDLSGAGAYLAKVDGDQVRIYPQGLGRGPAIFMSRDDWGRIAREVMLAMARADRQGDVS